MTQWTDPMSLDDLSPPPPKPALSLGEDLSALGVKELEARIVLLEEEIARTRVAIERRQATKAAADAFFKL